MPTTPVPPPFTHRTRPVTAALAACLAALALAAGCATSNTATTTTAPAASATATPTASPTPTLSPEDAAARATALAMEPPQPYTPEFTPDGAAEAATYFLNLFPYVFATGDLDNFKDMSEDDCEFCNKVINNATTRHDAGGWADPWEQEITPLEWWIDENDPNRYVVRTQVKSEAHTGHSEDGDVTTVEASDAVFLVQARWVNGDWRIEEVETEEGNTN
ncbi:DUF6318 family protein [Actinomyces ruminicola]|uniref:DUF6318 domain-containing protein n=1 Tax=Actinomyces ruminicola TaxID=332524 RepID=A0A1G9RK77_9ACTO|nr:DUF6318 family protein [Actinomyces ruminicola]SDM23317.1 hypothetical protein SAMN04487766_10126 [Actinomyces ruminicola]